MSKNKVISKELINANKFTNVDFNDLTLDQQADFMKYYEAKKKEELRKGIKQTVLETVKLKVETVLPFIFNTEDSTIANKICKFNLPNTVLGVKRIMLTTIITKGFAFGVYTDDSTFQAQFINLESDVIFNVVDATASEGRTHSFFFEGTSRPNLSAFNQGGASFGTVAVGNAGRHLVYHEDFNNPVQLNTKLIERLNAFNIRFYREDGSNMFSAHNLEFNPRELVKDDGSTNRLILIVKDGNDSLDFQEDGSATVHSVKVPAGIYYQIGNNAIIVSINSGAYHYVYITGGTFTLAGLAFEMQRALNADPLNTGMFIVAYNTSTNKFDFSNTVSFGFNGGISGVFKNPNLATYETDSAPSILSRFGFGFSNSTSSLVGSTQFLESPSTITVGTTYEILVGFGQVVAEKMNERNTLNTYRSYFGATTFPAYVFPEVSNGYTRYFYVETTNSDRVEFSFNFLTGPNRDTRIARTAGLSTYEELDIDSSATNSSVNIRYMIANNVVAVEDYIPYMNSTNQNPYWKCIMKGHFDCEF